MRASYQIPSSFKFGTGSRYLTLLMNDSQTFTENIFKWFVGFRRKPYEQQQVLVQPACWVLFVPCVLGPETDGVYPDTTQSAGERLSTRSSFICQCESTTYPGIHHITAGSVSFDIITGWQCGFVCLTGVWQAELHCVVYGALCCSGNSHLFEPPSDVGWGFSAWVGHILLSGQVRIRQHRGHVPKSCPMTQDLSHSNIMH